MKSRLAVAILLMLVLAGAAFAASGNKPPQMVIPFRNISSSTKPAGCVQGEMRRNDAYVFMCASSHHWRRVSIGNGF